MPCHTGFWSYSLFNDFIAKSVVLEISAQRANAIVAPESTCAAYTFCPSGPGSNEGSVLSTKLSVFVPPS